MRLLLLLTLCLFAIQSSTTGHSLTRTEVLSPTTVQSPARAITYADYQPRPLQRLLVLVSDKGSTSNCPKPSHECSCGYNFKCCNSDEKCICAGPLTPKCVH